MRFISKVAGLCTITVAVLVSLALVPQNADAAYVFEKQLGEHVAKVKLFGFSQLEARYGDKEGDDGLRFDAQRIRLGTKYYYGNMFAKLFLDFNQSHSDKGGGMSEMIKDAFVGYRFNNAAFVRLGMIKTPVGMMFTTPGWDLDIAERNALDKGLVLERDMGFLVSGRFIGFDDRKDGQTDGTEMGREKAGYGFGYDLGVFNPAGRSKAVYRQDEVEEETGNESVEGDANAFAGRIHFDWGTPFHFEASYGVNEEAGGEGSEDYEVFDIGIDSLINPRLNVKLTYTQGWNILGDEDRDQAIYTATVGYMLNPRYELVAKHYQASADRADNATLEDTDLGNTYIGLNFFLTDLGKSMDEFTRSDRRKLQNNRIQVNYVFASGDEEDWTGLGGYEDDAFMVQWQYKF